MKGLIEKVEGKLCHSGGKVTEAEILKQCNIKISVRSERTRFTISAKRRFVYFIQLSIIKIQKFCSKLLFELRNASNFTQKLIIGSQYWKMKLWKWFPFELTWIHNSYRCIKEIINKKYSYQILLLKLHNTSAKVEYSIFLEIFVVYKFIFQNSTEIIQTSCFNPVNLI